MDVVEGFTTGEFTRGIDGLADEVFVGMAGRIEAGAFWASTASGGNAMVKLIASTIQAPITSQGQRTTMRPIPP
jgi:hypothetical protein